jgi:hypothetical protein
MNTQNSKFYPLYTYGFIMEDVPSNILVQLTKETDRIKNNFSEHMKFNPYLAGRIEKEFALNQSELLLPYVSKLCHNLHIKIFPKAINEPVEFNFSSKTTGVPELWVNFQKKHEFNPLHSHTGFYSFVIWLKVPFYIEDEMALAANKEANASPPGFSFTYVDPVSIPGCIRNIDIPVDKKYEGKIVVFPAWLNHKVDPFASSDDYRISISGNLDARDP